MSFNANTLYPAVDIDLIAKQCSARKQHCYVVVDDWGYLNSVFRDKDAAESCVSKMNQFNEDYWVVQEHELI